MGDMADDFNAMREHSQVKRASNRISSAGLLEARGITFESKNGGAHLIVQHEGKVIDFWPGTGKWIARGSGKNAGCIGRGVFPLLKYLEKVDG